MNALLDPNTPGLTEALDRLEAAEKSEGAADPGDIPNQPVQREDGTDRAGADQTEGGQPPTPKPTDTPAAPDKNAAANESQKQGQEKPGDKPPEKQPADDKRSRFAKSQERLTVTWENANKLKAEVDARAQQLEQREANLKQRETAFENRRTSTHQPEDFEQSANSKFERARGLHQRAEAIEAQAKKAEDAGDYTGAARLQDEAKGLRRQAYKDEGNAEDLKAHAAELRKNPPPTAKQFEDQQQAQRKEWTLKAAQQYPDLAKENSDLQKTVANHLTELEKTDPEMAGRPQTVFYVTRLAAAESAAARVPGMEKELGELKAKVKELEGLTTPANPGGAQRPSGQQAKTDEEEGADLREEAAMMGGVPR